MTVCLVTLGVAPQQAIAQDCFCRSYAASITPIDYTPSRGLQVCFSLKVVVPEGAGEGEREEAAATTTTPLIDCLIEHESHGDPDVIGLAGEISEIQFLPSTYHAYCVRRYGFSDDIKKDAVACADRMIDEDPRNACQWSTLKFCDRWSAVKVVDCL